MNDLARQNYALTAETFDVEHFLQISCGDEVLVTVCAPAGPTESDFFVVFNGTGLDDDDNDLTEKDAVKLFARGHETEAWRQAARFGYLHALGKLMIQDKRDEEDALERAFAA